MCYRIAIEMDPFEALHFRDVIRWIVSHGRPARNVTEIEALEDLERLRALVLTRYRIDFQHESGFSFGDVHVFIDPAIPRPMDLNQLTSWSIRRLIEAEAR